MAKSVSERVTPAAPKPNPAAITPAVPETPPAPPPTVNAEPADAQYGYQVAMWIWFASFVVLLLALLLELAGWLIRTALGW
jgi:hypothetical protein